MQYIRNKKIKKRNRNLTAKHKKKEEREANSKYCASETMMMMMVMVNELYVWMRPTYYSKWFAIEMVNHWFLSRASTRPSILAKATANELFSQITLFSISAVISTLQCKQLSIEDSVTRHSYSYKHKYTGLYTPCKYPNVLLFYLFPDQNAIFENGSAWIRSRNRVASLKVLHRKCSIAVADPVAAAYRFIIYLGVSHCNLLGNKHYNLFLFLMILDVMFSLFPSSFYYLNRWV